MLSGRSQRFKHIDSPIKVLLQHRDRDERLRANQSSADEIGVAPCAVQDFKIDNAAGCNSSRRYQWLNDRGNCRYGDTGKDTLVDKIDWLA